MTGDVVEEERCDAEGLAIAQSPDPRSRRNRWNWVQTNLPEWLQRAYSSLVVPAPVPGGAASKHLRDLRAELTTSNLETAKAVLSEAEAAATEPIDRIESAERRATTLQGALAVAASVTVAGGGLLLRADASSLQHWRAVLAALLGLTLAPLLACAVRATQVTGRIFQFEDPGFEHVSSRASMTTSDALTSRAADLLRAAAVADVIASIKIGLLRSAVFWYRVALMAFAILITAILIAAATAEDRQRSAARVTMPTETARPEPANANHVGTPTVEAPTPPATAVRRLDPTTEKDSPSQPSRRRSVPEAPSRP